MPISPVDYRHGGEDIKTAADRISDSQSFSSLSVFVTSSYSLRSRVFAESQHFSVASKIDWIALGGFGVAVVCAGTVFVLVWQFES